MKVLDLFCGQGGAAAGYAAAGLHPVGIDSDPEMLKHYPYEHYLMDWRAGVEKFGGEVDLIHASPPCQFASGMCDSRPGLSGTYPNLIGPVRAVFEATGKPWVIENVARAWPWMKDPIITCGWTMGRDLYQHHLWEASFPLVEQPHRKHVTRASRAGHWEPGTFISVAGNCAPIAEIRRVMEIDWGNRHGLAEAVPPYMSEYIGVCFRKGTK